MTYREAVDYIEGLPACTRKHSPEHTKRFLKALGSPEEGQRILHVAGTNGKGSVCAYLRAMLMADGNRVGMFTSPHLVKLNERISLDGRPVDDGMFAGIFEEVKQTVDELSGEGFAHPSYFEFLFGMGMKFFQEQKPDYVILETGLGGRLDATNVIRDPLLTVITSISLDHTRYLGDTIAQIAREKVGIIKPGVPLIFDGSDREAARVLKSRAQELGAPCREITNHAFEIREITDKHIAFSRRSAYDGNIVWRLAGSGLYQAMNASLAIAAMETLGETEGKREKGTGTPPRGQYARWREALAQVTWAARMEEILPGIYLDGAHNPGAVHAFCDSLAALRVQDPVILFSVAEDKEYEGMIRELCMRVPARAYVITEASGSRRAGAGELAEIFKGYTDRLVLTEADAGEAFRLARSLMREGDRMYCLGSLYLAGRIKGGLENAEF